jgi:methanogenic corrinoid protein MtbC1
MSWLKSMMEKEPPEPENPIGTVVIGNIEPDMHDTAKEAVRRALKRAGFKTVDALKAGGLKEKLIIIMGGAAVKKEDAEAIGVLFGRNKEEGVEIAKKAVAEKK